MARRGWRVVNAREGGRGQWGVREAEAQGDDRCHTRMAPMRWRQSDSRFESWVLGFERAIGRARGARQIDG